MKTLHVKKDAPLWPPVEWAYRGIFENPSVAKYVILFIAFEVAMGVIWWTQGFVGGFVGFATGSVAGFGILVVAGTIIGAFWSGALEWRDGGQIVETEDDKS